MANPIIKIKRGNESRLYSNEFNITGNDEGKYLQPLEDGELAYNAWNNGLYIGYNGTNYLLSVANENNKNFEPQTFYGTATNALIASSLGGKTVGSSSKPIYLSAGSPIECGDSLDVDIDGNAATATKWQTARNFSISGTASDTTTYSVDGTKNITLTLPKTLSGFTSLSAATFTGGVWNGTTVAIDYGGTGLTSNPSMLVNLGSTTADTVFKTSPRPGVTGTLPVANGGTGATTLTSGAALIGNGTGAVTTRSITNNTTAGSSITASTNLITANTLANWNGAYNASGNSRITKLGTISAGVWNGTTIAVAYGGTGLTSNPSMLVNLGSTTADTVLKASPRPGVTGTLPVANGGTGATTFSTGQALIGNGANAVSTRAITNNTTATAISASTNLITANTLYYHKGNANITTVGTISSGVWNGTTISVAYGGTGNTSQTANRLIYSESASKLSSSGHYASSTKVAINSTTAPTEALYVNGNFKTYGNAYVDNGFISITRDGNPYIGLSDGANNWYYQSVKDENKVGLGLTWTSATKWDTSGNMYMPANVDITGKTTISGGIIVSGRPYGSGDDEGIVVLPAANDYAGISLGSHNAARTTLYLLPSTEIHRSVWRYFDGSNTYSITHPETNGEIVVHTADTAQGSETLPVYVAASGVVTPCKASSVFSDFSSTAGASGETLSITVAGQTRTVTLDAANESQGGVITTGTQTIAGQKTFNGTIYSSKIAPRGDMNTSYLLGDTSNTWYNIYSRSLSLYDGTNGKSGGQIYTAVSNATTAQTTVAELGNSTTTGTAGNRYGILKLYNEGSTYLNLVAYRYATNSTSTAATSRTIYLRDHGNTAYLAATTTRDAVGSGKKPVYVSTSGVITASSSNVGASANPIYMSGGTLTPSSSTLGATDTPIYMSSGELKACSSSKGSASVPVYMSSGQILQCTASSIFSSFTSSTNTLSITVCGQTRTASAVNSVSNTWTGGKTAGPKLTTTVNGVAGTAVAIPSASSSASGIVTTGAQTFAGTKTFNGGIVIATDQQIKCADTGGSWYLGRDNATVRNTTAILSSSWSPVISSKTYLGSWEVGICHESSSSANGGGERLKFAYVTDTNYNAGTNTATTAFQLVPDGTAYGTFATGNTGTKNPSGTPFVGTLYFKQI